MTPAIRAAKKAGITFGTFEYEHDKQATSYGLEAAQATGQPPARIFKTLITKVDNGGLAVALVPVHQSLDLKVLASSLSAKKAQMAEATEAQRVTGYLLGGISPLGQKKRLPTVLDESARQFSTIFVSGGRRGLELELAPADLLSLTGGQLAPIAR